MAFNDNDYSNYSYPNLRRMKRGLEKSVEEGDAVPNAKKHIKLIEIEMESRKFKVLVDGKDFDRFKTKKEAEVVVKKMSYIRHARTGQPLQVTVEPI